jgi:DNA methylase
MAELVRTSRLHVTTKAERLTHYLFRYPAKFHPPVVRVLLEKYTTEGDVVLDPFCGSGTLLVEAAVLGRSSIGIDVDPVAIIVARAKVHRYRILHLRQSASAVLSALRKHYRSQDEYINRKFNDLTESEYESEVTPLRAWVPAIPNLFHWFRRYVIIDLARIRQTIEEAAVPRSHRLLLQVVFASIIRNSSNADPVPVSGLEVTSHMKQRDAGGRIVDPFAMFERALNRAIEACEAYVTRACRIDKAKAMLGDATRLGKYLHEQVDAVITSPPYHGAVDYYRRHQLEMFWLGHTKTVDDRRALLRTYIGRPKAPSSHPYVAGSTVKTALAKEWENRIREVSTERANAFRHYMVAMSMFFESLAEHVTPTAPIVLIVGHSTWNKSEIPTTDLFAEIAVGKFELQEALWYPVKNRYMSYTRHNDADISTEHVLVFRQACD